MDSNCTLFGCSKPEESSPRNDDSDMVEPLAAASSDTSNSFAKVGTWAAVVPSPRQWEAVVTHILAGDLCLRHGEHGIPTVGTEGNMPSTRTEKPQLNFCKTSLVAGPKLSHVAAEQSRQESKISDAFPSSPGVLDSDPARMKKDVPTSAADPHIAIVAGVPN